MGKSLICLNLLLLAGNQTIAFASTQKRVGERASIFIIVLDQVSLGDLMRKDLPSMRRILPRAAVGLMDTRSADDPERGAFWISLGAGRKAAADPSFRPGLFPSVYGELAAEWEAATIVNSRRHTGAVPGLLGDSLWKARVKTAYLISVPHLVGLTSTRRFQDLRMGDHNAGGWIILSTESYRNRRERAEGLRLVRQPEDFGRPPLASVIVIEFPESAVMRQSLQARRVVERSLEQIARVAEDRKASVILLGGTSQPGRSAVERSLSPVVAWGGAWASALLTSASTRRPGIVSVTDLAPTVLSHVGLRPPPEMSGRPITMLPHPDPLRYVSRLDRDVRFVFRLRFTLVPMYLIWLTVSFGAACATLRKGWLPPRLVRLAVTTALCWPLALLLLPVFRAGSVFGAAVVALTIAVLLAWAAESRGEAREVLARVGLATALAVLADTFMGARLAARSVLGHDPILGQRFYGVGNEYMAVLVGAWAVGLGCSAAASRKQVSPALHPPSAEGRGRFSETFGSGDGAGRMRQLILWMTAVAVVGAPWWGANLGGAMTAAAAVPVAVFSRGGRFRAGHLFAAAVCMMASAALFVWVDLMRSPEAQTHMARATQLAEHGGAAAIVTIGAGKIWHSLALLGRIPLSLAAFAFYLFIFAVLARPRGIAGELRENMADSWSGIVAAGWAAIVACVANDSGVVAGGAAMQWAVGAYLRLALDSRQPTARVS